MTDRQYPSFSQAGSQNVFTLEHIQVDHDSKQSMNLPWNQPNTFSELVWTNLPIDLLSY